MADTCRSCRAPVRWARSAANPDKSIPLDTAVVPPDTAGALAYVQGWAYSHRLLVDRLATSHGHHGGHTNEAAEVLARQYPHHLSHFATCPNASQHRRPR